MSMDLAIAVTSKYFNLKSLYYYFYQIKKALSIECVVKQCLLQM